MADIVSGSDAPVTEDKQGKKSALVKYVTNGVPSLLNHWVAVDQSKDRKEVRLQVNTWNNGGPLSELWVSVGADNKVSINDDEGNVAPKLAEEIRKAVADSIKDSKLDPKEAETLSVLREGANLARFMETKPKEEKNR